MWQLVKTEIEYFKMLYILSLASVVAVNLGLTIDDRWVEAQNDFPGLRVIWIGISIVVFFFTLLFNRKIGRLRNNILLPLSNIKTAISRLIPFIMFWIFISVILIFFYIININSFPTVNWLLNFLSLTGIILVINSIPIFYSDFYSTYFSKKSKIYMMLFWIILWTIYILMNIIFATYFDFISAEFFARSRVELAKIYFSDFAPQIYILLGVVLFFGSIFTFNRRKIFLE